ncbi:hypothetical protein DFJ74DRAFT_764938 [Hyaloraphidium curvatum]|nr:hypothetical protein DFJ74DRAFT_764938 [Hyaloraphidium curvatum]
MRNARYAQILILERPCLVSQGAEWRAACLPGRRGLPTISRRGPDAISGVETAAEHIWTPSMIDAVVERASKLLAEARTALDAFRQAVFGVLRAFRRPQDAPASFWTSAAGAVADGPAPEQDAARGALAIFRAFWPLMRTCLNDLVGPRSTVLRAVAGSLDAAAGYPWTKETPDRAALDATARYNRMYGPQVHVAGMIAAVLAALSRPVRRRLADGALPDLARASCTFWELSRDGPIRALQDEFRFLDRMRRLNGYARLFHRALFLIDGNAACDPWGSLPWPSSSV